ncbi:MAG: tRNA glutamyl-Q(34) synthetase GluQRS [Pseudoflavonifractor sp.]|nr:tRNA glutamyl-Q(34) synthetase GluQRS [Alloprevotella sp.]MCM1116996.1 tRNA glutamyl-Q(34) synthetase GluQRS [Pseudoflavonifractor sp.]
MSTVTGRFAPSPSGRMHLGNIYAALMSWLSVRRAGGRWILRIEDLDPQRSRPEYARQIEDDLHWLGLEWDEGGIDEGYCQSLRHHHYAEALERLNEMGLVYACQCTRADLLASSAPHLTDGRLIYPGRCRPDAAPPFPGVDDMTPGSRRLYLPEGLRVSVTDRNYGRSEALLAREVGDFVVRRADGAWAYQLAVVVDDALMGVSEVVRGVDLLFPSAHQQAYLYSLLGWREPEWAHIPLLTNEAGQRLSKRDASLSMGELRAAGLTPEDVLGRVAAMAGLISESAPTRLIDLL